ncbi:MAG: metal-dependent phosphohydrolase [Pirellula sp.]|nr:metal-dependent phosphohydrolase [Pirellula sp.]
MSDAPSSHHPTTEIVLQLFQASGNSQYGGEAVTQQEHALQAAFFAEQEGAPSELIAAALLHDVGHLLHSLPDDAPEQGVDDRHETLAAAWLAPRFPPAVVAPVAMHVAAKRYLCAVEPEYLGLLSGPSVLSLELQGGPMSTAEMAAFERLPHFHAAVRVRRWDERAKIVDLATPNLEHFARHVDRALES